MKFKSTAINPVEYDYGPRSVVIGYFDNDNQLDLAVANSAVDNIGIFLGHGDGTFSSSIMYSTGFDSIPIMVTVGDFNNDHHLDLAVSNFGSHSIGLFLRYGNGTFSNQTMLSTNSSRPL